MLRVILSLFNQGAHSIADSAFSQKSLSTLSKSASEETHKTKHGIQFSNDIKNVQATQPEEFFGLP